jgi:hypothetical protein
VFAAAATYRARPTSSSSETEVSNQQKLLQEKKKNSEILVDKLIDIDIVVRNEENEISYAHGELRVIWKDYFIVLTLAGNLLTY